MAQFILLNGTWVGTRKRFAGELVDDAVEDKAPIQAAGGQLFPLTATAAAGVTAAAVTATSKRLQGADDGVLDGIMLGAAAIAALSDPP